MQLRIQTIEELEEDTTYYHKEKRKNQQRRSKNTVLMSVYGVTLDWYEQKLKEQGGHCAAPGCTKTQEKGGRMLSVDHDHDTGKPRGILCIGHNVRLQDIEFHQWALDYLKSYEKN